MRKIQKEEGTLKWYDMMREDPGWFTSMTF